MVAELDVLMVFSAVNFTDDDLLIYSTISSHKILNTKLVRTF